ncbi:hypothetical protein TIFTF001_021302 [Ficus carica]|uniref:B box-type domain-containing protein n=1 Tax=Ficus carica TaxID=3494 RepID=A0AA88AFQ3_FICCA|nr:hypothetical protein TIFTF001_021302 [Ficus carica]
MGTESSQAEIRKEKSEPSGLSVGISKSESCELCQADIAVVYCRVDTVFLCLSCDARLHNANKALCITDDDDDDVHPLMRRHNRILVKLVPSPNDRSSNGHVITPPPAN